MDPDERRLPLAGPLPLELRDDPEELQEAPGRRDDAPRDDGAKQRNRVARRADEQQRRRQEARVPGELCDADRVHAEGVVLPEERGRRERERAHENERGRQREQHASRAERSPALAPPAQHGGHDDERDRRVGEGRVDRRRADAERERRLVGRV